MKTIMRQNNKSKANNMNMNANQYTLTPQWTCWQTTTTATTRAVSKSALKKPNNETMYTFKEVAQLRLQEEQQRERGGQGEGQCVD